MRLSGQEDFVYIVGCPRSGTYLLSTILNSSSSIAIPVETHFIPLFERILFLCGDLSERTSRERLLECIYDFLEIWTPRSEKGRDFEKIERFSLLSTKTVKDSILDKSRDYQDIVSNIFKEYAKIHHDKRWGDKSAFFHHIDLDKLKNSTPNLKVVHIIRDGRDVALSWLKTWFGPESLAFAVRVWATHVEKKREWGRSNPENYIEIKYEDLLEHPDSTLSELACFLGVKYHKGGNGKYQDGELTEILSAGGCHGMLSQPLDPGNREKWKKLMSEKDRMLFEYIAGSTLVSFGYEVQSFDLNYEQRFQIFISILISYVRSLFSLRQLKLRLKNILPLCLFLSQTIKFPLVRFLNMCLKR